MNKLMTGAKDTSYKFYQYFVCRVSGLPTNLVEDLKSKFLENHTIDFLKDLTGIEKLKFEISHSLYEIIKNVDDKGIRNKLISIRRDIFNEKRNIKLNGITLITGDLLQKISLLHEAVDKKSKFADGLKERYYEEKEKIRNKFIDYSQDEFFQKGLLLSSRSLHSLQTYYQKNFRLKEDRKTEQIERGLLRYFSRTSMKATPFGTFCAIIPGKLNGCNGNNVFLNFSDDPQNKQSLLLINKDIYGIISNFIRKDDEIRKRLSIELNKTIDKKETIFYFLTEIEGREVFQRLDINPVLELIVEQFESNPVIIYEKLIDNLSANEELDAEKEEVEAYIDKLIEIGFIRYKIGIPEQMVDWSKPLIEILQKTGLEKAKLVCNAIEKLHGKVKDYEVNNVNERANDLEELTNVLENVFKELNITSNVRSNLPLYEDATANVFVDIDEKHVDGIKKTIFDFIEITRKLAYPRTEHANMRHFFDKHYKDEDKEISLLRFYEDYYREHFKSHLEKQQKSQNQKNAEELKDYDLFNPFGLNLIKEIQNAGKNISSLISQKWLDNPNAIEINIAAEELKTATESVEDLSSKNFSVSLFSQLIPSNDDGEKVRLILTGGHYMLGFGKYFSRFLYLFNAEVLDEIYESNSYINGEILAEISGDANFNANLHPPLLKYEISYPTTEIGLAEIPINCTDIIVEKDPGDPNRLRLKHKKNNEYVVPLDLGFLNPMMRPPLFQLLSKFSPPCNFSMQIPEKPIPINNEKANEDEKVNEQTKQDQKETVMYRPRILFENKIVLSRRCWFVSKTLLPQITNEETDFEFFIRVNKWKTENGIPDGVYVKIRPLPLPHSNVNQAATKTEDTIEKQEEKNPEETLPKEENKLEGKNETPPANGKANQNKFSRDYYKPQYIDFFNPLLVDLFGKMTVGLKNFLVTIEERYPGKEQLPDYNGKTFAVEQIFQIDYRKNGEE